MNCFVLCIQIPKDWKHQRFSHNCKLKILTSCDNVKNARNLLIPYFIGCIAEESSVIQFGHGSVRNDAWRATSRNVWLSDIHRICRVVKRPFKLNIRGIGVYLTCDLRPFLFRNTVYVDLFRFASRCIWKRNRNQSSSLRISMN